MPASITPPVTPDHLVPPPPRRRRPVAAAVVTLVLLMGLGLALAALVGVFDSGGPSSSVPRTDPDAVAAAYLQLTALGDPGACDLAAPPLRNQLTIAGRCTGTPAGHAPAIIPLHPSVICGTRASVNGHFDVRAGGPETSGVADTRCPP